MNDLEKSILLAKAMGLTVEQHEKDDEWFIQIPAVWGLDIDWIQDFYDPFFMALAWQVHLWVLTFEKMPLAQDYFDWFRIEYVWGQDNAQRLWLDKIVELLSRPGEL